MALRKEILVGTRFGKWEMLGEAGMHGYRRMIRVACPHGESIVQADNLLAGKSLGCRSCGLTSHNLSQTPEYRICYLAIRRCVDPTTNDFEHYGGKAVPVTVHHDWHTPENLGIGAARMTQYVLDSIGPRPSTRHQIDRKDNSKGYEPGNLRWATPSQNCRNRSNNRELTHGGKTQCTIAWAEELGLGASTISHRLQAGDPDWLALAPKIDYQRLKKEWKKSKKQEEAA